MIDPDVMEQLVALGAEIRGLHEEMSLLSKKLDANNRNLVEYMELHLGKVRDAADRATQRVAMFDGKLQNFTDEQQHFKTDFQWWTDHLTGLVSVIEATSKKMADAEARIEKDNRSFKDWVTTKINQIGRIFRR